MDAGAQRGVPTGREERRERAGDRYHRPPRHQRPAELTEEVVVLRRALLARLRLHMGDPRIEPALERCIGQWGTDGSDELRQYHQGPEGTQEWTR